jgi:hypothetical protein
MMIFNISTSYYHKILFHYSYHNVIIDDGKLYKCNLKIKKKFQKSIYHFVNVETDHGLQYMFWECPKLESFQTRETWGKWVLAKWVEKVGLAFGGQVMKLLYIFIPP